MPSLGILALLALASFAAGFFDAVVGGGGLITIPALLAGLPTGTPLPTVLGTNKVLAFTGTSMAAGTFFRSGALAWRDALGPILSAMLGAALGVALAYRVKGDFMRPMMLALLVAMLFFTLMKPNLGEVHAPKFASHHQRGLAALISVALGFYDGFFGPGTGSLLIFLFVSMLGFDFLRASALAKGVNWASNLCSMILFLWRGSWIPSVALTMALANGIGGYLGAHVALNKGSRWVRLMFIGVVVIFIARFAWQMIHPL
jgi:uncharacterized protein